MKPIHFSPLLFLLFLFSAGANASGSMLRVICEGDDVGAEVTINGKFKGECPVDIEVAPGMLKLSVKKNDATYDRVFEQDIRMGDGIAKKVEAVLSKRLNAAAQKLENERLVFEARRQREDSARREAIEVQSRAAFDATWATHGLVMVRIPGKNYEIGKTEVTQGLWKYVMGNNPSHFNNCGDSCPVDKVSWSWAQSFLQKLNAITGKQYRLPTEAEWEYACYAGSQTEYCGGNDLDAVAWSDTLWGETHPVGQKQANGYGLYDMTGNVEEWINACYKEDCRVAVIRGGHYESSITRSHASFRSSNGTNSITYSTEGFRLARTLP